MKNTNDTKENSAKSPVGVTRRRLLKGSAAGLVGATVGAPFINKQALGASNPIEITVASSCCSKISAQGSLLTFWGDEMERRTDGEVKVTQYSWSGSLTKWSNTIKSIGQGIVEAGDVSNNSVMAQMPLTIVLEPVFKYEGYAQGYFHGRDEMQALDKIDIQPLDLKDSTSVEKLASQIGGQVDIIINNAGFTRLGGVMDSHLYDIQLAMDINVVGLARLASAFVQP